MNDRQIQEIANRVIAALEKLAPGASPWYEPWAAFGSYATLLAAAAVLYIGWRTLKQKREADARSEWWRRTQWALEAVASADAAMYAYGTGMLDLLAKSDLASPEDKELLDAVWEGTSTEMQDADIEQLFEEARVQEGLTDEQLITLRSYFNGADDLQGPVAPAPVDDGTGSVENGSIKEEENG